METSETFSIPDDLPVLFLVDTVICPYAVIPLRIQTEESKAAIRHALMRDRLIVGVRAQEADPPGIATVCRVAKSIGMPDGSLQVIVQGLERVRFGEVVQKNPFYISRVALYPDPETSDATITALQETAIAQFLRLTPFIPHLPTSIIDIIHSLETPLQVVYLITTFLYTTSFQQQRVLEADTVKEKFEIITTFLTEELAKKELGTQEPIKDQSGLERTQQTNPFPVSQQKNTGRVVLGIDEQGKNVEISLTHRLTSVYCLGATGSGKTTLLEQMIVQDIQKGVGVCILDPHGDVTDKIINRTPQNRLDDVILLDPLDTDFPFGLNIYECPDNTDPKMVAYTLNNVMDTFEKLYDMSRSTPRMAQVMRNLAHLLIYNPGMTMLEIPRILSDQEFRSRLVRNLPQHLLPFWQRYDKLRPAEQMDLTDSSLNKIDEFITDPILYPIFGQSHTTISFRDIMDSKPGKPGKILLIRLARELQVMTSLIGSFLTGQLLIAALSRKDTEESKRRLYCLFCDEFQNFSTPSMSTLLTEARKYKIASHLFHQTRFQPGITDEIRSITMQAGSLIIFRVNPDDAKELAPAFNLTPPEAIKPPPTIPRDVINYLSRHPSEEVKEFYGYYVAKLQNALGKRETREYLEDMGSYTSPPYHDFGEGGTSFNSDTVPDVLEALNNLLYDTQSRQEISSSLLDIAIQRMAPLLRFSKYAWYMYDLWEGFTPTVDKTLQRDIAGSQKLKESLLSFLADDDNLMRFHYFSKYYRSDKKDFFDEDHHGRRNTTHLPYEMQNWEKESLEDPRRFLLEKAEEHRVLSDRYQSLSAYLNYLMPFYKQVFEKAIAGKRHELTEKITEDRKWNFSKYEGHYYKPWWEKIEDWLSYVPVNQLVEKKLPNEAIGISYAWEDRWCRFKIGCTVAEAQVGLSDEEHFLALLAEKTSVSDKGWGENGWGYEPIQRRRNVDEQGLPAYREPVLLYGGKTPETVRQRLTEECEKQYAFHEQRNTPEKLLIVTKAELEAEIAEVEARLQPMLLKYQEQYEKSRQSKEEEKATEKARHDRFLKHLTRILNILITPDAKIEVPSTEWHETLVVQQTYADRQNQVANELAQFPVGRARVKLPTGEYLLTTIVPQTSKKDFQAKKQRIIEHTRKRYCRSRADVEIEIRRRQNGGEPPPPITRKHPV